LTKGGVRLRRKMERLDEEALIFRMATGSAEEFLHCSYPRLEDETGKPNIRSSMMRFIRVVHKGEDRSIDEVERRVKRFGCTVDVRRAISESELDFEGALEFTAGKGFLPDNRFFWNAVGMINERWGEKELTVYDGVFKGEEALNEVGKYLEGKKGFSPTSLQQYAGCPFSYFLLHLLDVEVVEEPDVITVSPALRGSLVHRILAAVYSRLKDMGLLPFSESDSRTVMEVSGEVAADVLGEAEKEQPVGLRLFWEMERKSIEKTVKMFIETEIEEESDLVPELFEEPFGYGGSKVVSYDIDGRRVSFKGRIDRIDKGPHDSFRVIDYKTGKIKARNSEIDPTKDLQLPVYLIAASSILHRPVTSGTSEFRSVNIESLNKSVVLKGDSWNEVEAVFKEVVGTIVNGIEGGLFFPLADDDVCKRCAVRPACPTGYRDVVVRKVMADERTERFRRLRGIDGAEKGA